MMRFLFSTEMRVIRIEEKMKKIMEKIELAMIKLER